MIMKKQIKIIVFFCTVVLALTGPAIAKDVKFELNLDKQRTAIGENAQLGLSFYGTQSVPAPDIGNIPGLEIHYVGPSTMMTVINGQVSSSITHMYTVQPLKIGKFQIGPLSFKYKNDTYSSNMIFLEVSEERIAPKEKEEASTPEKLNLDDRIFVTLDAGKAQSYVNELIPVTVKLYVNRLNVSDIQLPAFDQEGFSKVDFKEPKQYREQRDGLIYDVLEFKTKIFGTKPGDYRLGPARIKCSVMVKKRLARGPSARDDMFGDDYYRDSFFEEFFTHYERHPMDLKSHDTQLIILPLPVEGRPKDFSGAVGDYQFIYNVSPGKVKVGDPVTLRMDINGTGNFNTVLMPKLDSAPGFKAYEPDVRTEENSKGFTQVLIPETESVTQVPRATFTYFDTNKKEYKTITQGPMPIQVEKGKEEAPSQVVGPARSPGAFTYKEEEPTRDIIYIKEAPGRWLNKNYGLYRNKVFLTFLTMPLLFLIALSVIQARRNRFITDSVYAGRIRAYKSAKKGIKVLVRQLKSKDKDPKIFYETMFKALQDYLGNRIHVPPAGVTSDIVDYVLENKGIEMDILRKLKGLFDVCDRARFAFLSVTEYKMEDDLKELQEVVNYFERKKL